MFPAAGAAAHLARRASHIPEGVIAYWCLNDPRFRAEMRFCNEAGIPHSVFLGWAPADQDKALGYAAWEGRRCSSCGVHPDEWPSDEGPPPFDVDGTRCFGCVELGRWTDHQHAQSGGDERALRGVRVGFVPRFE